MSELSVPWSTWRVGASLKGDLEWLNGHTAAGQLPEVTYTWSSVVSAREREKDGTDLIVWWIDPEKETKHFVELADRQQPDPLVLIASQNDWWKAFALS